MSEHKIQAVTVLQDDEALLLKARDNFKDSKSGKEYLAG